MTGPRWRELAEQLTADIRAGRRKPGEKLPSLAEWARADPPYSQTVTLNAYRELEARGLARSVHGLGTFVTETLPAESPSLEARVAKLERDVNELKQHRES